MNNLFQNIPKSTSEIYAHWEMTLNAMRLTSC